jgi:hypothetical protein
MTPVWLLDVDGVLNAARPGWGGPPARRQVPADGVLYPMTWAPALMKRLTRIHRAGSVEIRWSTTWVDEIAGVQAAMGLPRFPVAFTNPVPGTASVEAKEEAALHVVETEGRPLIWTDDTAIPADGPVRERLAASGRRLLLLAPDSHRGLQPADLDRIEDFVASCRTGRHRMPVARSEDG